MHDLEVVQILAECTIDVFIFRPARSIGSPSKIIGVALACTITVTSTDQVPFQHVRLV